MPLTAPYVRLTLVLRVIKHLHHHPIRTPNAAYASQSMPRTSRCTINSIAAP
jgi:hypothetical protein